MRKEQQSTLSTEYKELQTGDGKSHRVPAHSLVLKEDHITGICSTLENNSYGMEQGNQHRDISTKNVSDEPGV